MTFLAGARVNDPTRFARPGRLPGDRVIGSLERLRDGGSPRRFRGPEGALLGRHLSSSLRPDGYTVPLTEVGLEQVNDSGNSTRNEDEGLVESAVIL